MGERPRDGMLHIDEHAPGAVAIGQPIRAIGVRDVDLNDHEIRGVIERQRLAAFYRLLAEPFIRGRELTVAVLGDEALCVTELKPKAGFYDFDAKYTDGMTEHVCPADVPPAIAEAMLAMALSAHRLLGCKGASRSDFRWDDEQGEAGIYLLEINTQPGMTPLSLVPEQAKQKGIAYGELVERIIAEALAAPVKQAG